MLSPFAVTEAEAAAIHAVYARDGEFAAAVELRRLSRLRYHGCSDAGLVPKLAQSGQQQETRLRMQILVAAVSERRWSH